MLFKVLFATCQFSGVLLWVDLGFLGLDKYVCSSRILMPKKSSKNHPLNSEEKEYNSTISSVRVKVEHAIANLKTFFILRIQNRMRKIDRLDLALELCTHLANFRLSN